MEKEKNRRINGRRTVKYSQLAKQLEEERKAAAAENRRLEDEENDAYEKEIHGVIEKLEKEASLNNPDKKKNEETVAERSNKRSFLIFAICAASVVILIVLTAIASTFLPDREEPETVVRPSEETELKLMDPELRTMWLSNRDLNEDYTGQIVFDSGLIDLPFVQAKSVYRENGDPYRFYTSDGTPVADLSLYNGNDVYIWTNWKTGKYDRYEEGGSVFMDYRNYLKDQNIILYGHHFARDWDPEGRKQFTPLDLLLSKENYEENKSLKLVLDNEIRSYVVTHVFTIDIENDYEIQITRTNMNEDFSGNREPRFFQEFISYMDRIARYDTGESLSDDDRILTLITCLEHQPRYRQIVVCKEVSDEVYDPA